MRQQLLDLINSTILFKYDLPNAAASIERTIFSNLNDKCYEATNNSDFAEIIYNSIIEYSFNEFEINEMEYGDLQSIAFQDRIRYNENDSDITQLKYGFFGEVVLYAVLKIFFGADAFIARGVLYNPLEKSESKGYDAYHLIETDSRIQLWLGETKFHQNYASAVSDVLSKIHKTLSDDYLKTNLLALRKHKDRINIQGSTLEAIMKDWSKNPSIVITDELSKHDIELVFPIMILFQQNAKGYDDSIKAIPDYIKDNFTVKEYDLSIPFCLYFIFIPLENVKAIKTEVLTWIKSKKQLL